MRMQVVKRKNVDLQKGKGYNKRKGGSTMEKILSYLRQKYDICGLIVYGSYADGSQGENSDFDGLIITNEGQPFHDDSFVEGVQLDLFGYSRSYLEQTTDYDELLQIFDGVVLIDTDGVAAELKQRVNEYLQNLPRKTEDEIRQQISWCRKMLLRAKRGDAEGMFRWHWLLTDSLEIFCERAGHFYFGPKKTLKWMEKNFPQSFGIYYNALTHLDESALTAWIDHLEHYEMPF